MSVQYDEYIEEHKSNVYEAFNWLLTNIPELTQEEIWTKAERLCAYMHDDSKYDKAEYDAYDAYFYGSEKTQQVKDDFKRAWLLHIHRNPHHWQYWILNNDEPEEGECLLEMPHEQILAMICDWWSFSWKTGDLYEIFNWYDSHKDYIKLNDKTRATVEDILDKIKDQLDMKERE